MRILALAILALSASCGLPTPIPRTAHEQSVVLISIDGLPAYALEDPRVPAPTLQRLAREGSSARRMTIVNPAVTWPNHSTLATGVSPAAHGVLYNGLLLREPGKPPRVEPRSRRDLVQVPTVYDVAHQAGLSTAQVDWVPGQTGGSIDWAFEEVPDPHGAVERDMVAAGLIAEKDVAEFKKGSPAWRDQQWTLAATHILRTHRPRLLLVHLLNLDATHHRYGPRTPASMSAIALADARVAEILGALRDAGLERNAAVIVVSDHGFRSAKRSIRPNAALAKAGMIRLEGAKIASCDAYAIPEGGTAMVYFTSERPDSPKTGLRQLLGSLEGVASVLSPPDYGVLGLPDRARNPQAPDFILVAAEGYSFDRSAQGDSVTDVEAGGTVGHHGCLASDPDMDAVFIAWGRGIRPGVRLETMRNLDVAPTVASLLGLRMPPVEGRPVGSILE